MAFHGSYRFASTDELESTLTAVQEMLAEEADEIAGVFEHGLKRRGAELRVDIDTRQPSDWYYTLATFVEALAERAVSGAVESSLAGNKHVESYVAAAASTSLTKMRRVVDKPTWHSTADAVRQALYEISGEIPLPPFEEPVRNSDNAFVRSPDNELSSPPLQSSPGLGRGELSAPSIQSSPGLGQGGLSASSIQSSPGLGQGESPAPDLDIVREPDNSSVADKVADATGQLASPPALLRVPGLSSLRGLMELPPLTVPPLVLVPELVPPADLAVVARSVGIAAASMLDRLDEDDEP